MTKNEVKRILKNAWYYRRQIQLLKEKILDARDRATKVTASWSKAPAYTGAHDKIGDSITSIMRLEEEIALQTERLMLAEEATLRLIGSLPEVELQHMMTLRYVQRLPWIQVAKRMDYSVPSCLRLHGKALKMLTKVDSF